MLKEKIENILEEDDIYETVLHKCSANIHPSVFLEIYTMFQDGSLILIKPSSDKGIYDMQAADAIFNYLDKKDVFVARNDRTVYMRAETFFDIFV